VPTLVISDLHLGAARGTDVLRRAELREPLLEAVRGVDRLVILGDALELRDGPQRDARELAAPFFADVGRALGPDGELLLLAGNHDHGLVAGWIDGRLLSEPAGFLELEQRMEPHEAGPLAAALAGHAAPALVRIGGTLPLLAVLAERGITSIVSGFALPDDAYHAPNESYRLESLRLGEATAGELYAALASLPKR
jgi:hypothetical protein